MTDLNRAPTQAPTARAPRTKKALSIAAAVVAASAIAAFSTTSFSQGFGPGGGGPGYGRGMGPGMGPGMGMGPRDFADRGPVDPARVEARIDRMVRHMAVEVGANADQQEKLATIGKGLVKDLVPLRQKMAEGRQQVRDLLTAQTIDRAALEKLRTEQIATHDAFSKRFVQSLADAAEVLNPDQRTKLKDLIAQHRGGWGHMGGMMGRGMGGMMGHGMGGGWGGWR